MDLSDYARTVRRRWAWVAASVLVTLAGASWWAISSPTTYQSTATVYYVEPAQNLTAPAVRLNSFVILATSDQLVTAVRRGLGLSTPTAQLADQLVARFHPETAIVSVTATDTTAGGARALAGEATRQLVVLSGVLETQVAAGPPVGRLVNGDAATEAVSTSGATAARTIALGALLGLLIGIVLALIREACATRITHPDQLRRWAPGVEVYQLEPGDDVEVTSQASTRLRALRAMIATAAPTTSRAIVVSCCDERDHAPGIAGVVALIAARASTNVILVSAHVDPGRGPIPDWARAEPGLSAVLRGECPLSAAIRTGPVSDLRLLPAGPSLSGPEAVLASRVMVDAVEDLTARSAAVVIDAPPLLPPADTLAMVGATGAGVLLVVVEGRTRRRTLRATIRMLDALQAHVVGAVLVPRLASQPAWPTAGRSDVPSQAGPAPSRARAVQLIES